MHTQNVCKLLQSTAHKTEERKKEGKKQEIEREKIFRLIFSFFLLALQHCIVLDIIFQCNHILKINTRKESE